MNELQKALAVWTRLADHIDNAEDVDWDGGGLANWLIQTGWVTGAPDDES